MPPFSTSLPLPPDSRLLALLPMRLLARSLPLPLIASVPVRRRASMKGKEAREKDTELFTLS